MFKTQILDNMEEIKTNEANKNQIPDMSETKENSNPCLYCNRSAEEDNMIGCHSCTNWLHYSCDPEVKDQETADKIKKYYCPPCRKNGEEFTLYRAASIKIKDKLNKLNENENGTQSKEESSQNDESDLEYAEEAISSPTLTPYQASPKYKETQAELSDHELTKLIESVPDHFNNEWKIKDIVERIKRVSISNEQNDENETPEKTPEKESTIEKQTKKLKKKTLKKAMQHRKKSDILNEYNKLNKEIEKLNNEKEQAENKITQLEKSLETELQYREKMEKIEKELETKDDSSIEKRIFEAENLKDSQEKKINHLMEKVEDYKKKNSEKQNEIKELKKENETKLNEITIIKTAYEKETDLRTKAESLLHLTEEKLEAQILLYDEEKTVNSGKTKQIEELKEKMELQDETEINNKMQIESLESKLKEYEGQIPKETPQNPNVIDDNREMVKIIEKLEQENHDLTVKVVEANIEINIRKKLVEELNETHNSHLEKISKAYIENCIQFQKNVEEKIKTTEKYKDITNTIDNENENLKERLREKSLEVDSLKTELQKIGEQKYEIIKKKTEPNPKPQGIPNKYINGCYMIAPLQALATTIDTKTLEKDKNENNISKHILDIKDCIKGYKNETEAEEIMENVWNLSSEKWPQYTLRNERAKQEDATEYMDRILLDSEHLRYETELTFTQKAECTNSQCELVSTTQRKKSNTNTTSSTKGIGKIELQDLIDKHLLKGEEVCSACHENSKIKKEIEKAPQILIVDIPRHTDDGEKIETEVVHSKERIIVHEKGIKVEYRVTGVIIHRGIFGQSGHYVYNQYDYINKKWRQIDDHMILVGNEHATENKHGTMFLLKRLEKVEASQKLLPNHYRDDWQRKSNEEIPYTSTTRNTDYPCKFFKYDRCNRGNTCRFLHHTCRDFLKGECKYNDYCRYRHPSNQKTPSNLETARIYQNTSNQTTRPNLETAKKHQY